MEPALLRTLFSLTAGPLLIALGVAWRWRAHRAVSAAVPVTATVLDKGADAGTDVRCPWVRYRYSIAGRTHTASRIHPPPGRLGGGVFFVWRTLRRYRPGQTVTAYYQPGRPEDAFLERRPDAMWLIPVGLGAALLGLALTP